MWFWLNSIEICDHQDELSKFLLLLVIYFFVYSFVYRCMAHSLLSNTLIFIFIFLMQFSRFSSTSSTCTFFIYFFLSNLVFLWLSVWLFFYRLNFPSRRSLCDWAEEKWKSLINPLRYISRSQLYLRPHSHPPRKDHHYDDADSNLNWLRCLCWCQILGSTLVMVLLMRQDRREIMSPVLVFREWR